MDPQQLTHDGVQVTVMTGSEAALLGFTSATCPGNKPELYHCLLTDVRVCAHTKNVTHRCVTALREHGCAKGSAETRCNEALQGIASTARSANY